MILRFLLPELLGRLPFRVALGRVRSCDAEGLEPYRFGYLWTSSLPAK